VTLLLDVHYPRYLGDKPSMSLYCKGENPKKRQNTLELSQIILGRRGLFFQPNFLLFPNRSETRQVLRDQFSPSSVPRLVLHLPWALRHIVFNCGEPMAQPTIIGNQFASLLRTLAERNASEKRSLGGSISEVVRTGNESDQSCFLLIDEVNCGM
jgi:hypothetical protein